MKVSDNSKVSCKVGSLCLASLYMYDLKMSPTVVVSKGSCGWLPGNKSKMRWANFLTKDISEKLLSGPVKLKPPHIRADFSQMTVVLWGDVIKGRHTDRSSTGEVDDDTSFQHPEVSWYPEFGCSLKDVGVFDVWGLVTSVLVADVVWGVWQTCTDACAGNQAESQRWNQSNLDLI